MSALGRSRFGLICAVGMRQIGVRDLFNELAEKFGRRAVAAT